MSFLIVTIVIAFTVPALRSQRETAAYAAGMPRLYSVADRQLANFRHDETLAVPSVASFAAGKTDAGEMIQVLRETHFDAPLGLRNLSVAALIPGSQRYAMEGTARLESLPRPNWIPDEASLAGGETTHQLSLTTATPLLGRISGGGLFHFGAITTVEAMPAPGKHFIRWDGSARISNRNASTTTVTIDEDRTITAVFGP